MVMEPPDGCDTDDDNDSIPDTIDTLPLEFSTSFSDGTTFGTITSEIISHQFLTITDDLIKGVDISSTGSADVSVCGSSTLQFVAGSSAAVLCSSVTIEVISGTVDITFVATDGTTGTTTLGLGGILTFDPTTFTITNSSPSPAMVEVNGKETTIPSGETVTLEESLLDQKLGVIETLTDLKTGDEKSDKKIDKVIKHITKSTDEKFWDEDGDSLDDKKSKKVFDKEKKAVKALMKILKKGDSGIDTEISDVIAILVDIDRELAQDAINEAKSLGDGKEIGKAEKELAKGDKEAAKGKFDKAIDKYKKAWEHAQKALKKKK